LNIISEFVDQSHQGTHSRREDLETRFKAFLPGLEPQYLSSHDNIAAARNWNPVKANNPQISQITLI